MWTLTMKCPEVWQPVRGQFWLSMLRRALKLRPWQIPIWQLNMIWKLFRLSIRLTCRQPIQNGFVRKSKVSSGFRQWMLHGFPPKRESTLGKWWNVLSRIFLPQRAIRTHRWKPWFSTAIMMPIRALWFIFVSKRERWKSAIPSAWWQPVQNLPL